MPVLSEVRGGHAQPGGQHTVVRGGGAASLQVPEDRGSGFDPGDLFDLRCEVVRDAAEADPTPAVDSLIGDLGVEAFGNEPFGDDDDRGTPAILRRRHPLGDLVEGDRELGHEDRMGAGGHARMQSDPADVASHDLDDHAAVVGLRSGAQPVDRFRGDGLRGVEPEGVVRVAEVVVDGLGDAHDVQSLLLDEPGGPGEGAFAADGDERIDAVGGHDFAHAFGTAVLIGVSAGSAEDGAASSGQTAHVEHCHIEHVVFEQAPPAIADADERGIVSADALADDAADDSIESRAVSARSEYTDLHSSCP